jgi:hypothetical protein
MGETCSSNVNPCKSCCNPDDQSQASSLPNTERDPHVQEVVSNVLATLEEENNYPRHSKTQKMLGDNLES